MIFFLFLLFEASISAPEFPNCGKDCSAVLINRVLTITGSGSITNYTLDKRPDWWNSQTGIKTVKIGSGFKEIGSLAFKDFSSLLEVQLPNTIERINHNAFENCTALTSVVGGTNIKSIYQHAFNGCSKLETFERSNSLTILYDSAFSGCTSLKEIVFPQTLEVIGSNAFKDCTKLSSVRFSSGLKNISNAAFSKCTNLKELWIPDSVIFIGNNAFDGCSELAKIYLPGGDLSIGTYAFNGCINLKEIYFNGTGHSGIIHPFVNCPSISTVFVSPNYVGDKFYEMDISGYFGVCGETLSWTLIKLKETLAIKGSGEMYDYGSSFPAPWASKASLIKTIIIDNASSVGRNAFNGLENLSTFSVDEEYFKCIDTVLYTSDEGTLIKYPAAKALTSYEISTKTTKILDGAFYDCNADLSVFYQSKDSPVCSVDWAAESAAPNIYVPSEYIGTNFCGVAPSRYGTLAEGVKWFFNTRDGSLVIEGTGSISQSVFTDTFLSLLSVNEITSIKIGVQIDAIQESTFVNYSNLNELELSNNKQLSFDISILPGSVNTLIVTNTLVFGRKTIKNLQCKNSCIDDSRCSINDNCECELINLSKCPERCDVTTGQCRSCKNLLKSACDKSSSCMWEVSEDNTCGWCRLKTEKKPDTTPDYCDSCAIYESNESCAESQDCEWCNLNYCSKKGDCTIRCELITEEADCVEAASICSWCSTTLSCVDAHARCNKCSDFANGFCPRGCDCLSTKASASVVIITVVIVASVILIIVLLVFLFLLKRRFGHHDNEANEMPSLSNTSITLDSMFGMDNEECDRVPCANYANGDISEFVSCSDSEITFGQAASLLLLNKTYSCSFKLTNKSNENITVELYTCGFREKHKINFIPQKVLLEHDKPKKITVEVTFECCAMFNPATAKVCCGIVEKKIKNEICGLRAQTELSPLLSVDDLVIQKEIGRGSFGKVYKGKYKGSDVAIKTFSGLTTQSNNNEIDIFTKLRSSYVVTFYGICRTINSMVIEFCKYGSVESCYGSKKLTNDVKKLMCYDCAMGMNYLHQNDIIHRDLKPDNLLVVSFSKDKSTVRVKLSDFGTSRLSTKTMKMTEAIGTPVFMAPEVFEGDEYGKKSDVYSFGMTVWAIYAEKNPFDDLVSVSAIFSAVSQGKRPELISGCSLNDLITSCWNENPAQRPTFAEILEAF